ncbi:ovostatin-like isoform 1-T1 [Discoglossus pictus]
MYLMRILLSISLLCLIDGKKTPEPSYAMSIPAKMISGENTTLCATFKDLKGKVNITVRVDIDNENITLVSDQIEVKKPNKCFYFQAPSVTSTALVFVTFEANGPSIKIKDRRRVVISVPENVIVVQMDKQTYKPGDNVEFRVIALTHELYWRSEQFTAAYVLSPLGSRMYQWLAADEYQRFSGFEKFVFSLPENAMLGSYNVQFDKALGGSVSQSFVVDHYTLPKFSLEMDVPKTISIQDESLSINVTTMYTYGEGVPGKLSGRLCRPYNTYYGTECNRNPDGICYPITGEVGSDGKFSGIIDLTQFQMDRSGLQMDLNLQITMIEEGTGIQVTESRHVGITSQAAKVSFDNSIMKTYYKKNIPFFVRVMLVNGVDQPLSNETVELKVNGEVIQNLTTDANGRAEYEIDTSSFSQVHVSIEAIYKNTAQCYDNNWVLPSYTNAQYSITRFYSRSRSFVQIWGAMGELSCGQKYKSKVQYSLSREGVGDGAKAHIFYYMIMSKVKIVQFGKQQVDVSKALKGEFEMSFVASADIAPSADMIVYTMLQDEIITDVAKLNIEKCFRNKISMGFNKDRGTPGSSVDLQFTGFSRGMCAYTIIDSSLALLNPNQRFTPDKIYNQVRGNSPSLNNVEGYNVEEPAPPCKNADDELYYNGSYFREVSYPEEGDSYGVFTNLGLVFVTNSKLRKPEVCNPVYYNGPFFRPAAMGLSMSAREESFGRETNSETILPIETTRTKFPEVWSFSFAPISENSQGLEHLTVPDTITKWEASSYCTGPGSEFAMIKYPVNFTSFQPFFVDMSHPSKLIRGESMDLRVVVSNHLESDIKIRVTLAESSHFTAVLAVGEQDMCVPAGKKGSYIWKLEPRSLGVVNISVTAETVHIGSTCDGYPDTNQPPRKDTVIHSITVQPEGIEQEVTTSRLVCVTDTSSVLPVIITPPTDTVNGSIKAEVIVTGDILSSAVKNPGALIRKPIGCAEQILAAVMHIPSLLKYLNATNQLDAQTRQSALMAMQKGYMNMLQFQNFEGGFRTFSGWYQQPSSWLTALTYKTIDQMKGFFFVDQGVLDKALVFLERYQDRNTGAFKAVGDLYNNDLKGGANNDVDFTALVCSILLQSSLIGRQSLLRDALKYLVVESKRDLPQFSQAMLLNAFRDAQLEDEAQQMTERLMAKAVSEGGKIHWEPLEKPKSESVPFSSSQSSSAALELTGYVLMAMTKKPNPSSDDINSMTQIVLYLVEQMNPLGGFTSSADTAVILEGLANYGKLTYDANAANQVKVTAGSEVVAEFSTDSTNRLVVQRKPLPTVPGNYEVTVTGKGCCLVQTTVQYNIPVKKENCAFSLSIQSSPESCVNDVAYDFGVTISVSYNGMRNQSNMVLVQTQLPSGYTLEYKSLSELQKRFPKVEEIDKTLVIYIASMSEETVSIDFKLQMSNRVQNFQPSYVYIFDYYKSDEACYDVLYHPCYV